MALTWIFGGKKKDDKPVTVEGSEPTSEEGFTLIPNTPDPRGLYPVIPPSPYPPSQFYTPLPYSVLPQHQTQPSVGLTNTTRTSVQSQLDGVPFLLSPKLRQGSEQSSEVLSGLEDLRRAVFQIAADINDSVYDYNFKLEHTVLEEAVVYNSNNN